jgi:hypothetical protein
MDKATTKGVVIRLCSILNIGTKQAGSDGFFRSDVVLHNISKELICSELAKHPEWSTSEAYEYLLLPSHPKS